MTAPSFPSARDAAELPIDELAMRFLRHFAEDSSLASRSHLANLSAWVEATEDEATRWTAHLHAGAAWDWLIQRGLVALRPGESSFSGWGYVTERGHAVARLDRGLDAVYAQERIGFDLHPLLERKIRSQFLLGEYELAVFAAMREVEIRVRDLAEAEQDDVGVKLVRKAFAVKEGAEGPLTHTTQVPSEQEATQHFFAGALGLFKNPSSHRQVDFDDPVVASEIVLVADLMLRMLDAAEKRIEDYKRFMRDEVGDGTEEVGLPARVTVKAFIQPPRD